MKNLIEILKKYKVHILTVLLFIVYIGSCSKGRNVKILEKEIKQLEQEHDSLIEVLPEIKHTSYNKGYDKGRKYEKDLITNFILKSTKYPLDIKSRNLIVDITNDIDNNEHIKR